MMCAISAGEMCGGGTALAPHWRRVVANEVTPDCPPLIRSPEARGHLRMPRFALNLLIAFPFALLVN